jgi:hypothetical protein
VGEWGVAGPEAIHKIRVGKSVRVLCVLYRHENLVQIIYLYLIL